MKIKSIVEREDGIYEFQAELTPEQHQFLIDYAVKTLMVQGLLPFAQTNEEGDMAHIAMPSPTEQ